MTTSAARPDDLIGYTTRTTPPREAVEHAIRDIDGVVASLRPSADYVDLGAVAGLGCELSGMLAAVRDLDERVGRIGRAFAEADRAHLAADGTVTMADWSLGEALEPDDGVLAWLRGYLGGDLVNLWHGGDDAVFPFGTTAAGALRMVGGAKWLKAAADARAANKVAEGPGRWAIHTHDKFPVANNSLVGRNVARAAEATGNTSVARMLQSPTTTATLRKAGVAGGVVSSVADARTLVDHGRPDEAFQREGAGYVADVARTGFSITSTAFLLAPTPATGAAMIATGVAWAGAEAWDHWSDDVSRFVDSTWDTAGALGAKALDAAGALGARAWDSATDVYDDVDRSIEVLGAAAATLTDKLPW